MKSWHVILVVGMCSRVVACAPALAVPSTPLPTVVGTMTPTRVTATPTPCRPVENAPQVTGLAACAEHSAQGALIASRYRNSAGVEIATFDPQDKAHNSQLIWHWERMSPQEKDQALRWLFDPKQMRYVNFA